MGKIEELLALARDPALKARARLCAAESLRALGDGESAASALLEISRDPKTDAVEYLDVVGSLERGRNIEELLALASNEELDAWRRTLTAQSLVKLGLIEEAIPVLIAAIRNPATDESAHEGYEACKRAIYVLKGLERSDDLLILVRDPSVGSWRRVLLAEASAELGRGEKVVPVLSATAHDASLEKSLRVASAKALGRLGRDEEAVPVLVAVVRDPGADEYTCAEAADALKEMGKTEELLALARDSALSVVVRFAAVEALVELGLAPGGMGRN